MKAGYIYIMSSQSLALYIGVTADIVHRVYEHKHKLNPKSHTTRYNQTKLLLFEEYESIYEAIEREKQLKKWSRNKKLWLIEQTNPQHKDLAAHWYDEGYDYIKE